MIMVYVSALTVELLSSLGGKIEKGVGMKPLEVGIGSCLRERNSDV